MNEPYDVETIGLNKTGGPTVKSSALEEEIKEIRKEIDDTVEARSTAEGELDDLIGAMCGELDSGEYDAPFLAMMMAMYRVVPKLMECKELKLVEETQEFKYVHRLNVEMAEAQKNFAASGVKGEPVDHTSWQSGTAAPESDVEGEYLGLNAGREYGDKLDGMVYNDNGGAFEYMGVLGDTMAGAVDKIGAISTYINPEPWNANRQAYGGGSSQAETYDLADTLWSGLNGTDWRLEGDSYNNQMYDHSTHMGGMPFVNGQSEAMYSQQLTTSGLDEAVTQNAVMQTALNSYSKKVEAEFKFEMESYNSIVNLRQTMYQDCINLGETHVSRLRK